MISRGYFPGVNAMKPTRCCLLVLALLAAMVFLHPEAFARPGKKESREREATADALFTNAVVLRLKIEMPRAAMTSLRNDERKYVKATVREGATVYTNVMVHLKGHWGSFRPLDDKPGFTLNLGDTNGTFHGLRKFHLNNSVQDHTYLSEWLCGELFRAAGVPMPRAAHALVELNGRRLGVYVLKETVNRDFLAQYFENTKGNVYGQSVFGDVNTALERMSGHEDDTSRFDLRKLAAAARETNPDRLRERLPKVLDMDRFLSFMAMEVMLCDWDGYTLKQHNYRLYHNLDEDKMVFIPHDKDQMIQKPNERIMPQPAGIVAQAILRLPETTKRYQDRFAQLFTNLFVAPELNRRLDEMAGKLATAVEDYDPEIARSLRGNVRSLKTRINNRSRWLEQQLHTTAAPTGLQFVDNTAPLKGWYMMNDVEGATLKRVQEPDGKWSLSIQATRRCTASWRTAVSLEPGLYEFTGTARCQGVVALIDTSRGQGAGLRISGLTRPNRLAGDSPSKALAYRFRVTDTNADVTLVCELLATQGQVWFDEESLRLRRLP
jgi:spore coat protein H